MESNQTFFQTLLPFFLEGIDTINLTVSKLPSGGIAVTFLPKSKGLKEKSIQSITPLVLRGTAEEMDKDFFEHLRKPVEVNSKFFSSVSEFEASVKEAEKNSEMEKENKKKEKEKDEKAKKQKEDNNKKAETLITEVDALIADKKFDAAIKDIEEFLAKTTPLSSKIQEKLKALLEKTKTSNPQAALFH